jgi:hypothetical protein
MSYTLLAPATFPPWPLPLPSPLSLEPVNQPGYLIPFPVPIATEPITKQVNVPLSGSPVPLATTQTACCRISLAVIAGDTGAMFLGVPGLDHVTGANVIAVLAAYTSAPNTTQGQWAAWCGEDAELDLSDYVIDAAVSGEGLTVTYWPR